jgi:hypothetical protein
VRCRHHQLVPPDRRLTQDARISPEFNATLMSTALDDDAPLRFW